MDDKVLELATELEGLRCTIKGANNDGLEGRVAVLHTSFWGDVAHPDPKKQRGVIHDLRELEGKVREAERKNERSKIYLTGLIAGLGLTNYERLIDLLRLLLGALG